MANPNNTGIVIGHMTDEVKVFTNKDGSRKIMYTVAASDNFKDKDGNRGTQFIPLEAFVRADKADNGVYDRMHKGDAVAVTYSVRNNNYTKESGEKVYGITLLTDAVSLLDSKATSDARQAARAVAATEA